MQPSLSYTKSNGTLCLDAYTNPDHPVLNYSINITAVLTQNRTFHYVIDTSCIDLLPEVYSHPCVVLLILADAANDLGRSRTSHYTIEGKLLASEF